MPGMRRGFHDAERFVAIRPFRHNLAESVIFKLCAQTRAGERFIVDNCDPHVSAPAVS